MATMQQHDTLAYIENAVAGNLDNQWQSKATNQAPVIWRKDDKQSAELQYFGTKDKSDKAKASTSTSTST
jgi:hypothetical protein